MLLTADRPQAFREYRVSPQAANHVGTSAVEAARALCARGVGCQSWAVHVSHDRLLGILPRVQRIKMGVARGGQHAHVWADENSVHILIDGELVKTMPSNLKADDLQELRMRGAQPAGPAPAKAPALAAAVDVPAGAVVEVDRVVDNDGYTSLAGTRLRLGADLHRRKITLRLDGHLMHVVHDGRVVKTLPAPIPADQRTSLRGARLTTTALPAAASGPISVQRKVPADGKVMVARQTLRIGRTYAGNIVTIHVEDTHFRVTLDGAEICIHPRNSQHPVTRWKAKIHAPRL